MRPLQPEAWAAPAKLPERALQTCGQRQAQAFGHRCFPTSAPLHCAHLHSAPRRCGPVLPPCRDSGVLRSRSDQSPPTVSGGPEAGLRSELRGPGARAKIPRNPPDLEPAAPAVSAAAQSPDYRIPRLHFPVNSRRFPEIFGDFCKNNTSFLQVCVESRFLPFAPADFRRRPEPVPRTQVLS